MYIVWRRDIDAQVNYEAINLSLVAENAPHGRPAWVAAGAHASASQASPSTPSPTRAELGLTISPQKN